MTTINFKDSLVQGSIVFVFTGDMELRDWHDYTPVIDKIQEHISSGIKTFVLDLSQVNIINDVGITMCGAALGKIQKVEGRLIVVPSARIKYLIKLFRLNEFFQFSESKEKALIQVKLDFTH